jgi:hypothetical protein
MVNVPKDFKDYDEDDPEITFRKNRQKYWESLTQLRKEFLEIVTDEFRDAEDFYKWVEDTQGFKVKLNEEGFISDNYEIVDEQKYIVYILKYGK